MTNALRMAQHEVDRLLRENASSARTDGNYNRRRCKYSAAMPQSVCQRVGDNPFHLEARKSRVAAPAFSDVANEALARGGFWNWMLDVERYGCHASRVTFTSSLPPERRPLSRERRNPACAVADKIHQSRSAPAPQPGQREKLPATQTWWLLPG